MRKRMILLEKCPNSQITPENWFLDIISDIEIKIDKQQYPNSIFFFKNDELFFEQDYKNDALNCHYYKVWSVLKTKFNLNNSGTQILIKSAIEKHFKIMVSTPMWHSINPNWIIESHFHIMALKPIN